MIIFTVDINECDGTSVELNKNEDGVCKVIDTTVDNGIAVRILLSLLTSEKI